MFNTEPTYKHKWIELSLIYRHDYFFVKPYIIDADKEGNEVKCKCKM